MRDNERPGEDSSSLPVHRVHTCPRHDVRMNVTKVRRVESVSTGTLPNSIVYAGDPIGIDRIGCELREDVDVVIVAVEHFADSWLVSYRAVHVRPELTPAS